MGSTNSSEMKYAEISSAKHNASTKMVSHSEIPTTSIASGSLHSGRLNNLEIYSLIWLDKNVNQTEENLETQKKLRGAINQLKVFDDVDQCVNYVKDAGDQKIVIIVSNVYCRQLVLELHHLPHLSAFYIYCMNEQANREWSKKYEKVMFQNRSSLLIFSFEYFWL